MKEGLGRKSEREKRKVHLKRERDGRQHAEGFASVQKEIPSTDAKILFSSS